MADRSGQDNPQHRLVKIAFGAMALICLLTGLILYQFAESFGLDTDTARYVAIAFLVVGASDYLVLRLWDRLVKRH